MFVAVGNLAILYVVDHLVNQWKAKKKGSVNMIEPGIFTVDPKSSLFSKKYDQIQEDLESLASMDELITGKPNLNIYSGPSVIRFAWEHKFQIRNETF